VASRTVLRIALGVVSFVAMTALAQQSLKINEPFGSQLSSGSAQSYRIELNAKDYVAGLLDQHGRTDLTILAPDGSAVRPYPGPGRRLEASVGLCRRHSGTYRIEVKTSATQP
jgi:hypothetical protein